MIVINIEHGFCIKFHILLNFPYIFSFSCSSFLRVMGACVFCRVFSSSSECCLVFICFTPKLESANACLKRYGFGHFGRFSSISVYFDENEQLMLNAHHSRYSILFRLPVHIDSNQCIQGGTLNLYHLLTELDLLHVYAGLHQCTQKGEKCLWNFFHEPQQK